MAKIEFIDDQGMQNYKLSLCGEADSLQVTLRAKNGPRNQQNLHQGDHQNLVLHNKKYEGAYCCT